MDTENIYFTFYTKRYDINHHKIEDWNIFNNWLVEDAVRKEVRKYLRNPSKYKCSKYSYATNEEEIIFGFDGLCRELDSIFKWQFWSRVEYEFSMGAPFEEDATRLEKIDCYSALKPNIPMIAREVIYQYKQQVKEQKTKNN